MLLLLNCPAVIHCFSLKSLTPAGPSWAHCFLFSLNRIHSQNVLQIYCSCCWLLYDKIQDSPIFDSERCVCVCDNIIELLSKTGG